MNLTGRLLVATPLIGDPNFERTVVLVLDHGDDGAFGVVLNRPSGFGVAEVSAAWEPTSAPPGVVFVGGPAGDDVVMGIGLPVVAAPDSRLPGGCTTVDLNDPVDVESSWRCLRLFIGSAGWAAGQLEDEVAEECWWVVDAVDGDVFTSSPDDLWRQVLRRQCGEVAWFADHPLDPSAN